MDKKKSREWYAHRVKALIQQNPWMSLPTDPKWPKGTLDEWYQTWRRIDGSELPLETLQKSTEFDLPKGIEMISNPPKYMGPDVERHTVHFNISRDESNIRLTPGDNQEALINNLMARISALFEEVSQTVLAKHSDAMFKIVVYDSPDRSGRTFSTKYLKSYQLIDELRYQFITIARNYDMGVMGYTPSAMSMDIDYVWGWDGSIRGISVDDIRSDIIAGNIRKTYYQPKIRTYKNCLFASIYLLLNWQKNHKLLFDSHLLKSNTRKFLQRLDLPKEIKNDPNWAFIRTICWKCNINLQVFDELGDVTHTIWINKSFPLHDICIFDNHAEPLIKWTAIESAASKSLIQKLQTSNSTDSTSRNILETDTRIQSSSSPGKRDTKIAAWDIETVTQNGKLICYLAGFSTVSGTWQFLEGFSKNSLEKPSQNCLTQFLNHLYAHRREFNGYTFYAHNGGKFDLVILVRDTLLKNLTKWQILTGKIKELNGRWINFVIGAPDGSTITFKDSYCLMSQPLSSLTREFGVLEKSSIEDIGDASKVTLADLADSKKLTAIKKYHKTDCLSLLQVISKFEEIVWERFEMPITRFMTAASMAKQIFLKRYYSPKSPVFQLGRQTDAYVREAYFGGRNECFVIGEVRKPVYYYDFTSLYPDVGRLPLPCEKPPRIVQLRMSGDELRNWLKGRMGFAKVLVTSSSSSRLPLHPVIHNHRLCFPILENPREMLIWMPEILYGWDNYHYEMTEFIDFGEKGKKLMKQYFEDIFEFKREAREKSEKAKEKSWKIILNSGYGFWGYNRYNRDTVKITKESSRTWVEFLRNGKLKDFAVVGEYRHLRVEEDNMSVTNVAIAAAITSYARIKLHKLMQEIKDRGGELYYCDTDSVVTDFCIEKDAPDLWLKYNQSLADNGTTMGGLKNELGIGESFEKAIIVGCKMYSLVHHDPAKSENRLKGFSRKDTDLKVEDIEKLSRGEKITQKREALEIGKRDYVKEKGMFEIKVKSVEKTFEQRYSKAEIDGKTEDGLFTLKPFVL